MEKKTADALYKELGRLLDDIYKENPSLGLLKKTFDIRHLAIRLKLASWHAGFDACTKVHGGIRPTREFTFTKVK